MLTGTGRAHVLRRTDTDSPRSRANSTAIDHLQAGWSPLAGRTDGRFKYVCSSAPELFDLATDPAESENLSAERTREATVLRQRIEALCARPRLAREPLEDQGDLQRQIEALGYAGTGLAADEDDPEPLAAHASPSPHRYGRGLRGLHGGPQAVRGEALARSGHGTPRARRGRQPREPQGLTLGLARLDLQRFAAAADAFRRVLAVPGGERIPAQLALAVFLYNLGHRAEALSELESALAETNGPPGALELLIRMLEESGRREDAQRARVRLAGRDRTTP